MEAWQVGLSVLGLFVILGGIWLGRQAAHARTRARVRVRVCSWLPAWNGLPTPLLSRCGAAAVPLPQGAAAPGRRRVPQRGIGEQQQRRRQPRRELQRRVFGH